ncbi:MAG: penicillin acylase family protein [Balneolales bacterium]
MYWTVFKLVPSLDRTVALQGLEDEVIITWDEYQVPHISAEYEVDVYMVTGYLHARDRLWQMTTKQYKLEGLHSREIDVDLLELDIFYRTMPFKDLAKQAYRELPERQKKLLDAYASGVNQFILNNKRNLPIEFTLSNANPIEWKPWHTLGVQLLWAWEHQQSYWTKAALVPLHEMRNNTVTQALTGLDVPHIALFGNEAPLIDSTLYIQLRDEFKIFSRGIYPSRTHPASSGFALSGRDADPESALFVSHETPYPPPYQGYEMVIDVGENRRSGVTIPGFPIMIFGQNEALAWAIQPIRVDDGDFITGRIFDSPIETPVNWQTDPMVEEHLTTDFSLSHDIIPLKNGEEFHLVTKRVLGKPVVAVSEDENQYLAFDWAGFTVPTDFGAYLDISAARNISELQEANSRILVPAIQLLFADSDGNSGVLPGGLTLSRTHPLKVRNHQDTGDRTRVERWFPSVTHSDGEAVFFQESPPGNLPPDRYVSLYLSPWERSGRIREVLEHTSGNELASVLPNQLSTDTRSTLAPMLTPVITEVLNEAGPDSLIEMALPYFINWDYDFRSNETAATLFELLMVKLAQNLYEEYLDDTEIEMIFTSPQIPLSAVTRLLLHPEYRPENLPISQHQWIIQSMHETVNHLIEHFGDEPHDWQWGSTSLGSLGSVLYKPTVQKHISARLASHNLFTIAPFSTFGSSHSIRASHFNFNRPFSITGGTSMYRMMFPSPEGKYLSVLNTGQSGNIFSNHYRDQFQLWKEGKYRTGYFDPDTDERTSRHIQRFVP